MASWAASVEIQMLLLVREDQTPVRDMMHVQGQIDATSSVAVCIHEIAKPQYWPLSAKLPVKHTDTGQQQ